MDLTIYLRPTPTGYCVEDPEPFKVVRSTPSVVKSTPQKYAVSSSAPPISMISLEQPKGWHWYSGSSIHPFEKECFAEYFSGSIRSKTPQTYMNERKAIIDAYESAPDQYLTAAACRSFLAGDGYSITKMHHFLERACLINYRVDHPSSLALTLGPAGQYSALTTSKVCGNCGDPCLSAWYTHKLIILCVKCFGEGNIPIGLAPEDFLQEKASTEKPVSPSEIPTDQFVETLKEFSHDLDNVSRALGYSKAQCINKLMELPIQELIDPRIAVKSKNYSRYFGDLSANTVEQLQKMFYEQNLCERSNEFEASCEDLTDTFEKISLMNVELDKIKEKRRMGGENEVVYQKEKVKFLMNRILRTKEIPRIPKINVLKSQISKK